MYTSYTCMTTAILVELSGLLDLLCIIFINVAWMALVPYNESYVLIICSWVKQRNCSDCPDYQCGMVEHTPIDNIHSGKNPKQLLDAIKHLLEFVILVWVYMWDTKYGCIIVIYNGYSYIVIWIFMYNYVYICRSKMKPQLYSTARFY